MLTDHYKAQLNSLTNDELTLKISYVDSMLKAISELPTGGNTYALAKEQAEDTKHECQLILARRAANYITISMRTSDGVLLDSFQVRLDILFRTRTNVAHSLTPAEMSNELRELLADHVNIEDEE